MIDKRTLLDYTITDISSYLECDLWHSFPVLCFPICQFRPNCFIKSHRHPLVELWLINFMSAPHCYDDNFYAFVPTDMLSMDLCRNHHQPGNGRKIMIVNTYPIALQAKQDACGVWHETNTGGGLTCNVWSPSGHTLHAECSDGKHTCQTGPDCCIHKEPAPSCHTGHAMGAWAPHGCGWARRLVDRTDPSECDSISK